MLATEAMLVLSNPSPRTRKDLPGIQFSKNMLDNFYLELDAGDNDLYIEEVQSKSIANPVIVRVKNMEKATFLLGRFYEVSTISVLRGSLRFGYRN